MLYLCIANEKGYNVMHTIIYSLRDINGETKLSIDLGANIIFENTKSLQLQLPSGIETLNKYEWVNKDRIFESGKYFFLVCTKQRSRDYVFDYLLKYAISKIDTRINYLDSLKSNYKKLLKAA